MLSMVARPLRVYVAGSSRELDRVRLAMDKLRFAGVAITHDWTDSVLEVGSANPEGATQADRAQWAWEDLRGVKDADILWVLWPDYVSAGACVELGYAFALNKRVIISGGSPGQSIFTSLGEYYDTDALARAEVLRG